MPEFVTGLPLHALVLHAVVVLLPLAVIGSVAIAILPAARARFGWLVVGVAAAATALVPIATMSGENLARRLPETPEIARHEELGDLMLYFALPMLAAVVALMVVHEVNRRNRPNWAKLATAAAAVLAVGFSVAAGIHVIRVGDAGSRSVWEYVQDQPPRP